MKPVSCASAAVVQNLKPGMKWIGNGGNIIERMLVWKIT